MVVTGRTLAIASLLLKEEYIVALQRPTEGMVLGFL